MFDDDDVDFAILAFNPKTLGGIIALLILVVILMVIVKNNKEECSQKHCETGISRLIENQCLCVTIPK